MAPRRKALPGTRDLNAGPSPQVLIGMAHVVVGAVRVALFLVQTVFSSGAWILTPDSVITALLAGATVLGGLWLADGRRRGAVLALTMDVLHVIALLLFGHGGIALDLFVNAALAVAVVWVLPRIEVEREAAARRGERLT